jgi:DNA-binding response OmpR family regulator
MEDWVVETADTGHEALHLIEAENFNLIVLDWMLPDADGVEVLQQIRARGRSVPVLVVTARDVRTDKDVALQNGASDFVRKPFAFDDFLTRCRSLIQPRRP